MYTTKRPLQRPVILVFIAVSFILAACSGAFSSGGWPGVTAHDNIVYIAAGAQVHALDIAAEEVVWTFPPEDAGIRASFFAAPAVMGDRLILGDYGATQGTFSPNTVVTVYGLTDLASNSPDNLWEPRTDIVTDHIIAPLLQVESQVFIGSGDNLVSALDAETGELQWQFAAGNSIWGQPTYDNGVLYVTSLDHTLYALSAESGEELWRITFDASLPSKPIVGDGLVYVGGFDKRVYAVSIETHEVVWETDEAEDWVWAAPALADGVLYYADNVGNVFAVDAATGEEIWTYDASDATFPTSIHAAPVVVDDLVYIAAAHGDDPDIEDMTSEIIALSVTDGEKVWGKIIEEGPVFTTPVVVGESLVVVFFSGPTTRGTLNVKVYGLTDGDLEWQYTPEHN